MAVAVPANLFPPQLFMRRHWRYVGRKAFQYSDNGGSQLQFDLLRLGYCGGLYVRLSGTQTIATSGAFGTLGLAPYWIVNRFDLRPPGAQSIINQNGPNLFIKNLMSKDYGDVRNGPSWQQALTYVNGVTRGTQTDQAFQNSVASGQTVELNWFIPLHRSAYDLRGLLPLQNQTTTSLFVTPGARGDVFATAGNISAVVLNMDVWQLVYAPPPANRVWSPQNPNGDIAPVDTSWIFTLEQQIQVPTLGDNLVRLDPHDTITEFWHYLQLNGAADDADVTQLELRFDESYYYLRQDPKLHWMEQRSLLGTPMPQGVFYYDFDRYVDMDGSSGTLFPPAGALSIAEWWPTDKISTIYSTVTIGSGATLGSAPQLWTGIERLQRLRA